jgi:CheY-like chemotaxis protein
MRKPLVLVAEDDDGFRSTLKSALQLEGYRVEGVRSGKEAFRRIRSEERRPDLVVLSLNLADMGGWDFLAARQKDPVLLLTPIIVMSTEAEIPREISPEMFLQKPFGFERFLQIVARILDWSSPDAERLPRRSEPWSLDDRDPHVVKNAFGQPVVFATSQREARRIIAAVNGVTRLSTEALEQGLVDKGLQCLYELNRYETDDAFRTEIDARQGLEAMRTRRREIAATLEPGETGGTGPLAPGH